MNQKIIAIAAVLAAALLAGIFSTTTMAVYADEEHGYDGDGDSSETSTEQELKQKNVGSGESTNTNCGSNSIDDFIAATVCGEIEVEDGLTPLDGGEERTSSHENW